MRFALRAICAAAAVNLFTSERATAVNRFEFRFEFGPWCG
jgi:hypothetical protein